MKDVLIIAEAGVNHNGNIENAYKLVDAAENMHIGEKVHTEFVGLKNCILVQTEDANLVLTKESSQEVKNIFQDLERQESKLIE